MPESNRKFVTDSLRKAGLGYLLKLGFSCFSEIGVCPWGKLRADILATNLKSEVVILEIKSSVADYQTDTKWESYLQYTNRFFFVFTDAVWEKLKPTIRETLLEKGAGVLVLCPKEGFLRVRMPCKRKPMAGKLKKMIITRMAWRGGKASKRNGRRERVFLTEEEHNAYRLQKEKDKVSPRRKRFGKARRRNRRRRSA